ncbi:[NiFe] hydrogenase metallocenter assembly protein HypD [Klebsiella pneumoniae]|nr:[NiFe] hydrogenase metallocenter assembly protein HypD [Klebsiella pneumoniae]
MVSVSKPPCPATALTLRQARERNVDNFYFFCQHITLLPTLRSLLDQPENGIDAFLAPGHVSMVIGTEAYGFIASDYHRPLVVAGFEPLDLLQGAVMLVEQTIAQRSDVENQYRRVVPDEGNPLAQAAMADVFRLDGDSEWRGLGVISDSGVAAYASLSALSMPRRIFARRRSACATTRAPAAARC